MIALRTTSFPVFKDNFLLVANRNETAITVVATVSCEDKTLILFFEKRVKTTICRINCFKMDFKIQN